MKARWWPAYAACVALVLAFHYRLALPGRALVANDFRALFIPLRSGLQQTLRAGEWPFWQRGIFFGYPILGDIQFQLGNPLTWLTLPLDAARGVTVQSLLELCIAACGMAYWMKQRGLRRVEGVFAGVCFALCLKQTVHLHHWTFASSTCAWPWMFAGLDGLKSTGRARHALLVAGATGGTWIGASPQMAWFGSGLAFLYALYVAANLYKTRKRLALLAVVAPLLGFALAAPLLLPVAELSALGPRGVGITYRFAASWSWGSWSAPKVWPILLLPRAWGGRPDYKGPLNYWEVQGYAGLLPMALLALTPLRRKGLWIFAAVALLGVWISFGAFAFLDLHRHAWELLPGYGGFRNPTRALMLSAFCVSLLAAEGLYKLRSEPRLRFRLLFALGVIGAGIAWCSAHPQGFVQSALRDDAEAAVWLLAATALWASLARADGRWACVCVGLFIADVSVQTWDSPEVGRAADENRALLPFAKAVPPAPEARRVAVLMPWGEFNNATLAHGWEGVTGYGPTPINSVLRLIEATWKGTIAPARPLDDDENFPRFRTSSPLLPLFAAPLLATNAGANIEPLARDGEVRLYKMPALPRVFWTGAWRVAADEQAGPLLPKAAMGQLAVLAEPFDKASAEESKPVPADNLRVLYNSLDADVTAPADGLAVILDPAYPGWTATVDGAPVPLLRTNVAFASVPVTAGKHHLHLSYFPSRLLRGLAIALLAAALLVLLCKVASQRVDTGSPGGYFPPP
jgi:hypothetical protein